MQSNTCLGFKFKRLDARIVDSISWKRIKRAFSVIRTIIHIRYMRPEQGNCKSCAIFRLSLPERFLSSSLRRREMLKKSAHREITRVYFVPQPNLAHDWDWKTPLSIQEQQTKETYKPLFGCSKIKQGCAAAMTVTLWRRTTYGVSNGACNDSDNKLRKRDSWWFQQLQKEQKSAAEEEIGPLIITPHYRTTLLTYHFEISYSSINNHHNPL